MHPSSSHHKVYIFGGFQSKQVSSGVQSLDLNVGEWKEEPELLSSVSHPTVASVGNTIFMFDTDENDLMSLDIDHEMKSWVSRQACDRLMSWCDKARMIAYGGELLIAGGYRVFARYNTSTDTWSTGNPPPLVHKLGALVLHGEKLYLIGGQNEDRAEEYNFDTNSWSVSKFKVPTKEWNMFAVSLNAQNAYAR